MRSISVALLFVLSTASSVEAQTVGSPDGPKATGTGTIRLAEPVRVTHPGRVLDANGQGVAGAEVTFFAQDADGVALLTDVVRVTTRKNGRFRAQLWPTRPYSAWATRALEDGTQVATELVERAYPMTELQFPEPGSRQPAREAGSVKGFEPWLELGAVRLEFTFAGVPGVLDRTAVAADGSFTLPALPTGGRLEVDAFVDDGLVYRGSMSRRGDQVVDLPPPQRVEAFVHDFADAPVSDAEIHRLEGTWRGQRGPLPAGQLVRRYPVARTGADGKANFYVAGTKHPREGVSGRPLVFVARKVGYREGVAGFGSKPFRARKQLEEVAPTDPLPFGLLIQEPVLGTYRGEPLGDRFIGLTGNFSAPYRENSYYGIGDESPLPFDAKGRLVHVPANEQHRTRSLRIADVLPPVAADSPFRRAVVKRPLVLGDPTQLGEFELDLTAVQSLALQVVDLTGGPAMGAAVACVPLANSNIDIADVPRVETDAVGRAVFAVVPGKWLLLVIGEDGYYQREIVIEAGIAPEPLAIDLEPLPLARYRVVDGDGEPIAGATFDSSGGSWGGGSSPADSVMSDVCYYLASWQIDRAVTDSNGCAEIPFLPNKHVRVDFRVRHGRTRSSEFRITESEDYFDIELR